MDALMEPPTQGVATVTLPPIAGVRTSLLRQLPLGLLAVSAHVGGLSTGLRVRSIGADDQARTGTVDLTKDRTFRAVLEHLDAAAHDGDSQHWLSAVYRVGAALPGLSTAPIELAVVASTTGFRCTVHCDPASLPPASADRLVAGMLTVRAHVASDVDSRVVELITAAAAAPPPVASIPRNPASDPKPGRRRRRPDAMTPLVPPRTTLERELVAMWQQVLALDELGVNDDFFESGGHSVMAAALVRQMQEAFGTDVPVDTVYLQPTVAAVAAEIEASRTHRSVAGT